MVRLTKGLSYQVLVSFTGWYQQMTKAKMLYGVIHKVSTCAYLSLNDITILES